MSLHRPAPPWQQEGWQSKPRRMPCPKPSSCCCCCRRADGGLVPLAALRDGHAADEAAGHLAGVRTGPGGDLDGQPR